MKKRFSFLLCASLLLLACQVTPTTTPIPPASLCSERGTVLRSTLDNTTRGYSYDFNVYLPPCYAIDTQRSYPIIYLVPGRGSGPGAWFAAGADKVADELILSGDLPPFVIVTTENTDSEPYADTILTDLIPYIESHFRIQPGREHHAVGGGSLGGIAAYRIAFRHPDQFASAAMFGSGLVSGEEKQVGQWLAAISTDYTLRVFLNTGEQDSLMLDRARVMIDILDNAGIEATSIFSAGAHNYDYWVSNFAAYLRWLAQDW